jgi:hypothetical protein
MRRIWLIASVSALISFSVAYAATGGTAGRPASLSEAAKRTAHVSLHRFAVDVRITRDGQPLTLHVRGASAPGVLSVTMKTDDVTLPDGTRSQGIDGAVLIDGPFLYERAPDNMAIGKLHWLRLRLADLGPSSPELRNIRNLTPPSLLQVLGEARMHRIAPNVFSGTLAYDDPVVLRGLGSLTGNVEFRGLRITAWVGKDGLLHRLRLTGHTANGSSKLLLQARLYAFGSPVHVHVPVPGAFLDPKLAAL